MFTEMDWKTLFEIAGAALAAIGSAGVLLFALSSWLGKVWASRILEKERTDLAIFKETVLFKGAKRKGRNIQNGS